MTPSKSRRAAKTGAAVRRSRLPRHCTSRLRWGTLPLAASLATALCLMGIPVADAAEPLPTGYSVDVDESGTTTSGNLGGSGSLAATGQGNVNYGWAQECAPSGDGGPFSSGNYPPATCAQVGRPYSSAGSPEQPGGFWFTGNQNCVNAGRPFSGAEFTWHVQLPQTGSWHVEVHVPSWTSYGWGDQYTLASADGQFQNYPFIQQAYHGQWVSLFGSHQFTANQDYTVALSLADGSDSYCHYQMADQMRWVYDGPSTTPCSNGPLCPPVIPAPGCGTVPLCPPPTSTPGVPAAVSASATNGGVQVSWQPPVSAGSSPITGYTVTVTPAGTDRVGAPSARVVSATVGASTLNWTLSSGLVSDCHERYSATVVADSAAGAGPPTVSTIFRPSGIVSRGTPPYVVILLDGISESKPGFTMDPYSPTRTGPASYCPENIDSTGAPIENAFKAAPAGPQEFFAKWSFFDPKDTDTGNNPSQQSNSTPRDLKTGAKTHRFMLDAIAATGAVILPFSYTGAALVQQHRAPDPTFTFLAYTACNSSPPPGGGPGCSKDPGGSPDDRPFASNSWSIDQDAETLHNEVASIQAVWGTRVPIIIVGHSQGGLVAFEAWQQNRLPGGTHLFSLDSPINGVCPARIRIINRCVGPAGYPDYDSRTSTDRAYLALDDRHRDPFRFIGTWGDTVAIDKGPIQGPAYGTGNETLQHQLLVKGGQCVDSKHNSGCPDWQKGPDHISECRIPGSGWVNRDQHFIVKFCPGNVDFFNRTLGLSY